MERQLRQVRTNGSCAHLQATATSVTRTTEMPQMRSTQARAPYMRVQMYTTKREDTRGVTVTVHQPMLTYVPTCALDQQESPICCGIFARYNCRLTAFVSCLCPNFDKGSRASGTVRVSSIDRLEQLNDAMFRQRRRVYWTFVKNVTRKFKRNVPTHYQPTGLFNEQALLSPSRSRKVNICLERTARTR